MGGQFPNFKEAIMASAGKVLIIVQNLPVPFDRRVWLEATTLRAADYQVSVICPKGQRGKFQESYECLDTIHIYRYATPPEAQGTVGFIFEFAYCWLMTAVLSLKVLWFHGFDLIHACNPPETYFLLALPYKLVGKKFIFDHHDLSPEMYLAKGGKKTGVLYRALLWLEKLTFATADVVITTNESHKQIAMKRGAVAQERIFIVRSGPDFERLQILPPDLKLKGEFPYLACYLGEMCDQDGVDYLLQAIRYLRDEFDRSDIRFVLMGGGPALAKLQWLKEELELNDLVEFTGRISDEDLCRYLSTADVCLDPDPYTDWSDQSTMNKIMEYMAFAKPIVAFDLRENRYSAQEAALYAQGNDVGQFARLITTLVDDETLRRQMGDFALQRVQNHLAWEYSKSHLLKAYDYTINLA
jgi:glycosyltransferase involved in cell wall biosynthesis